MSDCDTHLNDYEDDFEDVEERTVSSCHTSDSSSGSGGHKTPRGGESPLTSFAKNTNNDGRGRYVTESKKQGQQKRLIGNPTKRNVPQKSSSPSAQCTEDVQLLHASKTTSVEVEYERAPVARTPLGTNAVAEELVHGTLQSDVHDPFEGTGLPSDPKRSRGPISTPLSPLQSQLHSESSSVPLASPHRFSDSLVAEEPVSDAVFGGTQTPKISYGPINEEENDEVSIDRNEKAGESMTSLRVSLQRDDTDNIVWKMPAGKRRDRISHTNERKFNSVSVVVTPSSPSVAGLKPKGSGKVNSPPSTSKSPSTPLDRINTCSTMSEEGSDSIACTSFSLKRDRNTVARQRSQLLRKIAQTKSDIARVRGRIRSIETLPRTSLKSGRQETEKVSKQELVNLERENERLQRRVLAREGMTDIVLLLSVAHEEFKHAQEELKQVKQRKRELTTEDRRVAIMFSQRTKQLPTAEEQRARQQREGMYTRANYRDKIHNLQKKIEAISETSSHLSERIALLEARVKAEGLADIKAEDYAALKDTIKRNADTIKRHTASISRARGGINICPGGAKGEGEGEQAEEEDLTNVMFPGKAQMEAEVCKLIRQLERKDAQPVTYQFSFVSVAQRGGLSAAPLDSRRHVASLTPLTKHLPAGEKKPSRELRRASSEFQLSAHVREQKNRPPVPRYMENKLTSMSNVSPTEAERVAGGQQEKRTNNESNVRRSLEPKRSVLAKNSGSSLTQLGKLLVPASELGHEITTETSSLASSLFLNDTVSDSFGNAIENIKDRLTKPSMNHEETPCMLSHGVMKEEEEGFPSSRVDAGVASSDFGKDVPSSKSSKAVSRKEEGVAIASEIYEEDVVGDTDSVQDMVGDVGGELDSGGNTPLWLHDDEL